MRGGLEEKGEEQQENKTVAIGGGPLWSTYESNYRFVPERCLGWFRASAPPPREYLFLDQQRDVVVALWACCYLLF
jgi:hypothetical protein